MRELLISYDLLRNDVLVPRRRALELDQVVVGAVGFQQRTGVLEVLALTDCESRALSRDVPCAVRIS